MWPAVSPEDEAFNLDLHNAVLPARAIAPEDVASWRRAMVASELWLAELDGATVGGAHAALPAEWHGPAAAAYVLPHARGRGVGSTLLRTISDWTRERGLAELRTSVEGDDPASLAWVLRRGFAERTRETRMVLDLAHAQPPRVEPPNGIRLTTWAELPDAGPALHRVYLECERDIPGEEDAPLLPLEQWLREDMGGPGDRPEATFVALEGDEVVGFAKLSLTSARPDIAFHDLAAVRPAWRGRGIAAALKARQIAWAKAQGYARLETHNEERNEPIRRINARFGYREEPGRIELVGPIAAT